MERFSQRESILLGYNSHETSYTSPSTPKRNSGVDFHDVFGGPPKRSSIQEMRYSMSELQELNEKETASSPWPPVFGEENATRRRYPTNDFYDDIFGGEESLSSTPRKNERDIFSVAASTRVLSPALPLPPEADPFSPSSFPAQFSLPAKLTNGMDLPTFGSTTTRSLRYNNKNMKDATSSNGFLSSSSESPTPHLSRFSSHVTQPKEVFNNDLGPPYRQSLLSQDLSESHNAKGKKKGSNLMRQNSSGSEVLPSGSCQFHFSIYKWASNGVQSVMPLGTGRNSRSRHKHNIPRCSSAKDWIISDREITTQNDGALPYTDLGSFLMEKKDGSTSFTTQNGAELLQRNIQETTSAKPQSEASSSIQNTINDFAAINAITNDTSVTKSSTHSVQETGFSGKTKQDSVHAKPASKPLRSLFTENDQQESDGDEIIKRERGKESKAKSTKKSSAIIDVRANQNKPLKTVENKGISQGSNKSLDEKGRVQGKVKEFVRIFNQEASMKPKLDAKSPILGSEYKQRGALRTKSKVEDYPEQPEKENCAIRSTNISGNNLSQQDDISASAVPDSSVSAAGNKDGSYHVNFLVKELDQDEFEALEVQNNQEVQVIDAKIQQWSKGKEGNIRSLLSTLQYILWPESGWKPVPLVDIIEGNAVKRAYQRALLCLHPDKLQQKGAASHQKYTAEKTFDILQEAWAHFNMLGAL